MTLHLKDILADVLQRRPKILLSELAALLDGERRPMGHSLVGDAEPIQIGKKVVRRGRRGSH